MKQYLNSLNSKYFFNKCHNGCVENIENLSNLPFFDEVYKYYKEFADNNKVAYLEQATDYIIEKLNLDLSNDERKNLKTYAFYCGSYLGNIKKTEKIKDLNEQGFYQMAEIREAEQLNGQKIEFIVDSSGEFFGGISKYTGKLKWSSVDKRLMAMKSRCRRTGFWVDNKNIYIKLLT